MTFTAFVVEVTAEEVDPLADALLDAGALSVSCEDARAEPAAEAPHFDGSGESVSWARVRLTALCKAQPEPEQLLLRACNRAGIAVPIHELHSVPDEDWVAKSREQFAPIQISAHLWILPTWRAAPEPEAINLVLDPGLAFGTGRPVVEFAGYADRLRLRFRYIDDRRPKARRAPRSRRGH